MSYVKIDPSTLPAREPYRLLTSLVVPRPIAWVSSLDARGTRNLAPHSYFNVISSDPLIVHFTSTGVKDSLRNVRQTGEFVVNIVNESLAEKMNLTSARFPPEEDEFEWADVDGAESSVVAPPRVAGSPAAFECKLEKILSMGNGNMVFGNVVCIHIDEDVMRDGRVLPELLKPIGRLGGASYTAASARIFQMARPDWDRLRSERSGEE